MEVEEETPSNVKEGSGSQGIADDPLGVRELRNEGIHTVGREKWAIASSML